MADRRSFWAWGLESEEPTDAQRAERAEHLSKRYGVPITAAPVPKLADAQLRAPRLRVPDALASICATDTWERAFHSHGSNFTDRTRAFALDFPNPTDVVAHPSTEAELAAVLDWCSSTGAKVVPFGAGSSVVWGVNPPDADAVVTIALDRFDKVLEVDAVSRAARIQAGIYGPALEDQLRPHGFTLRHFPQSFRFSTLGGWIATRSGGHYATNHTHIDDFVESTRMLTPQGWWESRRLPGSGAGPSPDRLVIGSEGILGVITEAGMRRFAGHSFACTMRRTASAPASHEPNTTPAVARKRGRAWLRIHASVMMPRMPSLPITRRSGLGPAPEPGRRRLSHQPCGVSMRVDSTKSSMWVWFVA